MQLSLLPLAALAGLAAAQMVHVVTVGKGGSLGTAAYSPSTVTAAVGDMVQYQFMGGTHGAVQSTFDKPCEPAENNNKSIAGFYSGMMTASGSTTNFATFTIMVNSSAPIWVYCPVATHCQDGMSMVINQNTAANSSRSLDNYRSGSKNTVTVVPTEDSGSGGTVSTGSGSSTNSTSGSGSGTSSGSGSGSSGSATTSGSGSAATGGASSLVSVPSTLGLLAALGAMLML